MPTLIADALKEHWPNLSAYDCNALLWCATSYPLGRPEVVAEQVQEMAERSGCDLDKAMWLVEQDMTQEKQNEQEKGGE